MNPLIPIFQKKIVQNIFQRVLYVWAVRHPASGYVQGINDFLNPFFTVFLTEYCYLSKKNFFNELFFFQFKIKFIISLKKKQPYKI